MSSSTSFYWLWFSMALPSCYQKKETDQMCRLLWFRTEVINLVYSESQHEQTEKVRIMRKIMLCTANHNKYWRTSWLQRNDRNPKSGSQIWKVCKKKKKESKEEEHQTNMQNCCVLHHPVFTPGGNWVEMCICEAEGQVSF